MNESYDKDIASHIGPEACGFVCKNWNRRKIRDKGFQPEIKDPTWGRKGHIPKES